MENDNKPNRALFGSRLGIIAAATGSAVGLGNIWKFPYITGQNGGGAFLLVYLFFVIFIGAAIMTAEFLIGRRARANASGAFKKLSPNTFWSIAGRIGVLSAFMILAFYCVVAGWTLEYILKSITGAFEGKSAAILTQEFSDFVANPIKPILFQLLIVFGTAIIVYAGVTKGIEKYSKIFMPILLLILVALCVKSLTLEGGEAGLRFLFYPDFSKLTTESILIALGHSFFTLSLGMGTMITYGSYIDKDTNLMKLSFQVMALDTLVALLAGIAIFPTVFAYNIEPGYGTGLVFVTLPNIFQQMAGGAIWATLFFILLALAAITSTISILEVIVANFIEELHFSRKKSVIIASLGVAFFGMLCSLSMGNLSEIKILGLSIFDFFDKTSSNILLPLGGMLISLYVGWKLNRSILIDELSNQNSIKVQFLNILIFVLRYVAPIAIVFVFLYSMGIIKG